MMTEKKLMTCGHTPQLFCQRSVQHSRGDTSERAGNVTGTDVRIDGGVVKML
jgi:hypothetical protein